MKRSSVLRGEPPPALDGVVHDALGKMEFTQLFMAQNLLGAVRRDGLLNLHCSQKEVWLEVI